MWVRQKLRNGLFKPTTLPRVGVRAPRGMLLCVSATDPSFFSVFNRMGAAKPDFIGSLITFGKSYYGSGATAAGTGSNYVVGYQAININNPVSVEVLVIPTSVGSSNAFVGYNNTSTGGSGTYDKTIGINLLGQFAGYVFPSGEVKDATTTPVAGRLYHLVMTDDGSTTRLYVNGVQMGTNASTGSYSGYTTPFFNIGGTQCNATNTTTTSNAIILQSIVANACWTAAEVAQRAIDPFGFLEYPDDDLFSELVGAQLTVRPRIFRVDYGG